MPVEKAGRLLVELNRSEIARERLELDYKKKTELAFEELETRMYKLIKGYPELREKLVEVLKEAKQKWLEQQEELK